ncbi:MAG: GNAT family N-acetyltransferase [Azospirillum sp.]|nr:GNAT family N-acetyltransferase [Azospirillum sp.]
MTLSIRTMSRDELEMAIGWAAAEGWNPGLHDGTPFHATDPEGFLVAVMDGRAVGAISAVRYPEGFAFIGFYVVCPERRGRQPGFALARAALARVAGAVSVGIDGVVARQANYTRLGFALAYRNIRMAGPAAAGGIKKALVDLREVPFGALAAADRRWFPAPRPHFLANWLALPDSRGVARWVDGRIAGYGVIRRCREGAKIGPLFAEDDATAEALFMGLCAGFTAGPVFLDTPEVNPAALALAQRHGLTPSFETARMYLGPPPALDLAGVFGVTTFELG